MRCKRFIIIKYKCLWGRILFLATRKLVCPLWRVKPARFCSQATWEDFECSPTSAREAPHSCLISVWHKHECIITTIMVHSCLCQALIRHEWDASLADVGLHSKSQNPPHNVIMPVCYNYYLLFLRYSISLQSLISVSQ